MRIDLKDSCFVKICGTLMNHWSVSQ
jgi:hypothetical protein